MPKSEMTVTVDAAGNVTMIESMTMSLKKIRDQKFLNQQDAK